MRRSAKAGAILASALLLAFGAGAHVPSGEAVAEAVAQGQKKARRGGLTEFRIRVVRQAEGELPVAVGAGAMWSDPEGRARLTLQRGEGEVERQLRSSEGFAAAEAGRFIRRPLQILPPLWVLQAEEGALLLEQLAELGGDPERIELGYEGAHDCFVLGGREGGAAFWIDQYSHRVIRIDLASGVRYRLGPITTGDGTGDGAWRGGEWPAWIDIETPAPGGGATPAPALRLELSAGAMPPAGDDGAAPRDFDEGWLLR